MRRINFARRPHRLQPRGPFARSPTPRFCRSMILLPSSRDRTRRPSSAGTRGRPTSRKARRLQFVLHGGPFLALRFFSFASHSDDQESRQRELLALRIATSRRLRFQQSSGKDRGNDLSPWSARSLRVRRLDSASPHFVKSSLGIDESEDHNILVEPISGSSHFVKSTFEVSISVRLTFESPHPRGHVLGLRAQRA